MPFTLRDLDDRTRRLMLDELIFDLQEGRAPDSRWLRDDAVETFYELLEISFLHDLPGELALLITAEGLLRTHVVRRTVRGPIMVKVPRTAAVTLAQDTFNHYFIRALCRRAIRYGIPHLVVCRARASKTPRTESITFGRLSQKRKNAHRRENTSQSVHIPGM